MVKLILSAIIISVLFTSNSRGEESSTADYIKKIIETKFVNKNLVVGISIAVYENDNAVFYNHGLAKKELNEHVTSNHIFEIGSITKTFTTTILADLINRGMVRLEDPVTNYLPNDVKIPKRNGKQITILDLATHRSGLPRNPTNIPAKHLGNPFAQYSVEDMYSFLGNFELTRNIGAEFEYSNIGMGLLGHILSLKAGKNYEKLVHDSIFKPLKMTSSFVNVPQSHQAVFVDGHGTDLKYISHWQMPTLAGAGALKSSAIDMLSYLKANLGYDNPIISALTLTHEIHGDTPENGAKIGLGWNFIPRNEHPYYWHNGQIGGFHSFMGFDKTNKRGIVILTNSRNNIDQIGHSFLNNTLSHLAETKPRIEIEIPASALKKLQGMYKFSSSFFIEVSVDNDQLYIQATNQPRFRIFAKSKTEFFLKAAEADMEFELDEMGNGATLILIQNNQLIKGIKFP